MPTALDMADIVELSEAAVSVLDNVVGIFGVAGMAEQPASHVGFVRQDMMRDPSNDFRLARHFVR